MSDNPRPLSRSNALIDITRTQFRDTQSTALSFSKLLFNVFCELVPEKQRTGLAQIRPWRDEDNDAAIIEANYKRFQRYMDGTTAIPMDLEEAWATCLLENYKRQAVIELCTRHGAAAVEIDHEMSCVGVSELMKRCANMLEVAGDILDDGVVDESDRRHLPALDSTAKELISVVGGLLRDVEERLGEEPSIDFKRSPVAVETTPGTHH
jgi:hypothetical protein